VLTAFDRNHLEIGDQLLVAQAGGGLLERQDPILGPVDDERRDVDLGQVRAEHRMTPPD
jgi:hypothetical protein